MDSESLEKKKQYFESIQKSILRKCFKKSFPERAFRLDKRAFSECVESRLNSFQNVFEVFKKESKAKRSVFYFKFFYHRNPMIKSIYSEDIIPYKFGPPILIFSRDVQGDKTF